ncbi:MAG TPA: hypothetical protein QGG30_08725 [Acidobacteriota bacterium]|nr:hypothetical protein [Acidobacteriota bacterium]
MVAISLAATEQSVQRPPKATIETLAPPVNKRLAQRGLSHGTATLSFG